MRSYCHAVVGSAQWSVPGCLLPSVFRRLASDGGRSRVYRSSRRIEHLDVDRVMTADAMHAPRVPSMAASHIQTLTTDFTAIDLPHQRDLSWRAVVLDLEPVDGTR